MDIYNAIDILDKADIYDEAHAIVENSSGLVFSAPLVDLYKIIASVVNFNADFEPLNYEDEICVAFFEVKRESEVNGNFISTSVSRQLMRELFG